MIARGSGASPLDPTRELIVSCGHHLCWNAHRSLANVFTFFPHLLNVIFPKFLDNTLSTPWKHKKPFDVFRMWRKGVLETNGLTSFREFKWPKFKRYETKILSLSDSNSEKTSFIFIPETLKLWNKSLWLLWAHILNSLHRNIKQVLSLQNCHANSKLLWKSGKDLVKISL